MLKGWRGVALMGKGERRLLRERDAAAGTLSTHDPANDDDNKQIDDNAKFSGPGVVAFEALGRLAAEVAKRLGAGDFVSPNSVGICFDCLYCLGLVGRESRHKRLLVNLGDYPVVGANLRPLYRKNRGAANLGLL
jgi:hypothetical protein